MEKKKKRDTEKKLILTEVNIIHNEMNIKSEKSVRAVSTDIEVQVPAKSVMLNCTIS